MIKSLKIIKYTSLVLFCITSILLFVNESKSTAINYTEANKEMFEVHLQALNSVDKVSAHADSSYTTLNLLQFDTSKYVDIISEIIKKRFSHGLSNYTMSENWIAYSASKLVWSHFSAIVKPDDILTRSEGICSQQNIVFAELLKKKHITTRAVELGTKEGPGHYLTEVLYNGKWHLYDVDVEPNWEFVNFEHYSMDSLISNKIILYKIYENRLTEDQINSITENVRYGTPNKFPAIKMLFFHRLTKLFTYILPIIFLFLFIWSNRKSQIEV